jgi:serine/threonine protein kinase
MCANRYKVDLIDSMLVVDPERRFTIDQCLAHPWLTQLARGQEPFAKEGPVLHRIPTLLGSGKMALFPTDVALSEESERPKPGHSVPNTKFTMFEAKGNSKHQSANRAHTKSRGSQEANLCRSPKAKNVEDIRNVEDVGNVLRNLTLGKGSSENQLLKVTISKALKKANTAFQLKSAQDLQGARAAYLEAHNLLDQVKKILTANHKDTQQLEVIVRLAVSPFT